MEQLAALWQDVRSQRGVLRLGNAAIVSVFAATMFLSALLLFSVQPMFAKMALPALGGTPAVWAISMCFFQAALLGGYVYAHALTRFLDLRTALLTHVLLLSAAALVLPIGLPSIAANPPRGDAYFWLFGVLTLGTGLPFFAISANAPLLQAWFAKSAHPSAADPYFLYGASNAGSLLALLAYPVVIEPQLGLATQSVVWGFGFLALALMIAFCGVGIVSGLSLRPAEARLPSIDAVGDTNGVSAFDRLTWMALAAVPSGLMVAVTTYITTDIGSAPFIWVMPLVLFLVTFILVFRDHVPFNYGWVINALPFVILGHVIFPVYAFGVACGVAGFFLATIVCHRQLYLRRPTARHLTDFYICMSAGGVIGGIFSAIVAPQIFADVIEFKLLLLLSLLARPGVMSGVGSPRSLARIALFALAMTLLLGAFKALTSYGIIGEGRLWLAAVIVFAVAGVFLTRKWREHRAIVILTMIVALAVVPSDTKTIFKERSFFGTVRVGLSDDGRYRLMLHGNTVHGAERIHASDGTPAVNAPPATYYYKDAPMPRGVDVARQLAANRGEDFNVGVVGLGTGSLACFSQPSDHWRYFEIDPMVARVARNPRLFDFLSRCEPNTDIVFGDARLTLAREAEGKFGYLVIDAFSSDAIPVHLLTRQALEMYAGKLTPDGLLAIHISNRFLDLAPALAATASQIDGLKGIFVFWQPSAPEPDASPSAVVFLARSDAALAPLKRIYPGARPLDPEGATAWTDDYSNVLASLIRNFTRH